MHLITKIAYNALTKTIQAIAPGGQSVSIPTDGKGTFSVELSGGTTTPTVTGRYARSGSIVTITLNDHSLVTKSGVGPLLWSGVLPDGFRPASVRSFNVLATLNNVRQVSYIDIDASGNIRLYNTVAGGTIPDTQANNGLFAPISLTFTV